MQFDIGNLKNYSVSALAMARGEHTIEEIDDGSVVAFVILYGCIQITRQRSGQPASYCLHAKPRAPLFLINPGRYCIVAESNVLGVRATRRGGDGPWMR